MALEDDAEKVHHRERGRQNDEYYRNVSEERDFTPVALPGYDPDDPTSDEYIVQLLDGEDWSYTTARPRHH